MGIYGHDFGDFFHLWALNYFQSPFVNGVLLCVGIGTDYIVL